MFVFLCFNYTFLPSNMKIIQSNHRLDNDGAISHKYWNAYIFQHCGEYRPICHVKVVLFFKKKIILKLINLRCYSHSSENVQRCSVFFTDGIST